MAALEEIDLKLFVQSIQRYMRTITRQEPAITSAYLSNQEIDAHEYNGVVSFSGTYTGHVIVSMPQKLIRELLIMQHETNLSEENMLDAVGEIANTLAGNARKELGAALGISVPVKLRGSRGLVARVRPRPYVITFLLGGHQALVCVDMEKSQ